MPIEEYTAGEWSHAFSILGSTNITIENLEISKSGGDGIYIGVTEKKNFCENITINNVICDGNARNGVSVISAKKVIISNSTFTNSGVYNSPGLAKGGPWAGVDLEPNKDNQLMDEISISDCNFSLNKHLGIFLYFATFKPTSAPISVTIKRVNIQSSVAGISVQGFKGNFGGRIDIENVVGEKLKDAALIMSDWGNDKMKVSLSKITLRSNNTKIPVIRYTDKDTEAKSNITKRNINFRKV